jgi:hypothetical protein
MKIISPNQGCAVQQNWDHVPFEKLKNGNPPPPSLALDALTLLSNFLTDYRFFSQ